MSEVEFPSLTPGNHPVTSPATPNYNCVAWSANDTENWWQPGVFWPVAVPSDSFGIEALRQAFESLGYLECDEGKLEPGFDKVALYGTSMYYTHASRQLPNGVWTSKLGREEDIEHDTPHDVAGGIYGEVLHFMKRAHQD